MSYYRDLVTLLRFTPFRRLLHTRLSSQLADGAFQVALASYVVFSPERQATAGQIATALAVLLLPFSLLGPFTGVLLDRWRRRQVLLWCNVLRAGLAIATAVLLLSDVATWLFYLAALLVTAVNRFVLAGLSAALPRVVHADQLVLANAISPTAGTLAATLGGGSAFLVRLFVPPGNGADAAVVTLAALLYLLSASCAWRIPPHSLGPDQDSARPRAGRAMLATTRGLWDAVRHLTNRPPAGYALLTVTLVRLCYGVLTVTVLMLSRYTFNDASDTAGGLRTLGLALGCSGAGFFAAALLTPAASRRLTVSGWIVGCTAAAAVLVPALGLSFTVAPVLIAAFVLGVVTQSSKIGVDTIVQSGVDDHHRGRVFAVYDMLYNCAFVGAAALSAVVLPADGRSAAVLLGVAAGYALIAVGYGWTTRRHPPPINRIAKPGADSSPSVGGNPGTAPGHSAPARQSQTDR